MSKFDTDAIRAKFPIAEIIAARVPLARKSAKIQVGLCPFHNEKSPSFTVYEDNYHCFGCGASGDVIKFVSETKGISFVEAAKELTGDGSIEFSAEDRKAREEWLDDRRREAEEKSRRATISARKIWDAGEPAFDDHPYLEAKGITATGAIKETGDGKLLIPVYGLDGELQSIQTIDDDGNKLYQASAPLAYGSFCMGINMGGQTIVCEGYATGVSIYDAMAGHVCVAFDCGNMEKVARKYVERGKSIILAADTGLAAEKMAKLGAELGCPVVIPRDDIVMENGKPGTDFNDQSKVFGVDNVTKTFREALRSYSDGSRPEAVKDASGIKSPQLKLIKDSGPLDISSCDLSSPPGIVGDVTDWIDGNCFRPRRQLSVAAALVAISNITGLYYEDDMTGVTTNLFLFCVAGSGTGKDTPQKCVQEIMRVSGFAPATHGAFKSEQEIYRNLIRHQAAFYVIDELGQALMKVKNAQKRGGAAYLEGVIGTAISAFTKADDWLLLTGDAKEDVRGMLIKELGQINASIERDGENEYRSAKAKSLEHSLSTIDNGLEKPFLSVLGFSEPSSFNMIVDREWATNGLFRRVLIFNEKETVPRRRKGVTKQELPMGLTMRIHAIVGRDIDDGAATRIENYAGRQKIPTTEDAQDALDAIAEWFDDEAVRMKETGLESLYLGAEIQVLKVSLILAIEDGVRTLDHVRWAYALVRRDLAQKANMVIGNDDDKASRNDAVIGRIKSQLDDKESEAEGVIMNRVSRMNGISRDDVLKALNYLADHGELEKIITKHPANGTISHRYRLPGMSREKPEKSLKVVK